jgi:PhnB protein
MNVMPYLAFNGNCAEALALYEKAFGIKAGDVVKYSDAPPAEGYQPPAGTENFVMHTELKLGAGTIYLCDTTPDEKCSFSNGMSVHVSLDGEDAVKAAFDILKEGGEVGMEPEKTFWSKCFGTLTDKFGVSWMLSFEGCSE